MELKKIFQFERVGSFQNIYRFGVYSDFFTPEIAHHSFKRDCEYLRPWCVCFSLSPSNCVEF